MWRGVWCVVVIAVAGCDPPAYDLSLYYGVFDAEGLTFAIDGETVEATGSAQHLYVSAERHYESYGAAADAPAIELEAYRDGAIAWTDSQEPDVCAGFTDQCDAIVRARYVLCFFADGTPGGLCASLDCYDEGGVCGGWISGPEVAPNEWTPVGQLVRARRSYSAGLR